MQTLAHTWELLCWPVTSRRHWIKGEVKDSYFYFQLFPRQSGLWTIGLLVTASPLLPLSCPTPPLPPPPPPRPPPHPPPPPLSLYYLASLSSSLKRPSTAQPPWEQQQSSHQLKAQMHRAGLRSPAESTKCFLYLKDTERTQPDICCLILVTNDKLEQRKSGV